jgi:hypothetical protein
MGQQTYLGPACVYRPGSGEPTLAYHGAPTYLSTVSMFLDWAFLNAFGKDEIEEKARPTGLIEGQM